MISRSAPRILAMLMAIGPATAQGANLIHFSVSQVRQLDLGQPVVQAYLDLSDSQGRPVTPLPQSSLRASLGPWTTETVRVMPFSEAGQGIAYVFLVDISKSLSPELFQRMKGGIETWVRGLGPLDRAALIAFGESSELVVDFTDDSQAIRSGLDTLGPTDDETLLHQALADALELSRRLDPGLPGRRALVIFSDGKDEGSVFEAEDILDRLRREPSPIYAIGYSRLRDPEEHRRYLNLLQRFASNSGGAFFAAEQTRFAEAYETIRRAIRRVWVADFRCTECRADGNVHHLEVQVSIDDQVLSSGRSVRLLPLLAPAVSDESDSVPTPELAPSESLPAVEEPQPASAPEPPFVSEFKPLNIGLTFLVLAFFVWALLTAARRRQPSRGRPAELRESPPPRYHPVPRSPLRDPPVEAPRRPPPPPVRQAPEPPPPEVKPSPRPPKQVRLIVVRGSRRGRQYSFQVRDRAVVGKRSDCDCVLGEETGIDAAQFELIHDKGELYLYNLSDRYPTLVGGHPLTGKHRLTSDALIGTGETVLRIVFH